MDVPVMTDLCQGGPPDATPPELEGVVAENFDALLQAGFDGNYEDCGERHDPAQGALLCLESRHKGLDKGDSRKQVASQDQHKLSAVARIERGIRTDERNGNDVVRLCGEMFFRMDGAVAPTALASAIAFLGLPLLVFLGVMMRQWEPPLRLLTDLRVPALIVVESLIFAGPDVVLWLCLDALRKEKHGAPFAVLLLTRLLYTVWLVVWFKANGPLLASGFSMMLDRFVMAAFLYTYDGYSKYLVCSPRTLLDLCAPGTCALPAVCQKPSGRSTEDILQACACLYEMLATSQHGEIIQMHHEKYGPHMRNFVRDNALAACVWMIALCLAALVTFYMFKVIWDDVAAALLFCKCYTAEQRKGATRSDALHAAVLRLLVADTSLTQPLPVAGPSRTVVEQADVQVQGSTSAVDAHTTAVVQALRRVPDVS